MTLEQASEILPLLEAFLYDGLQIQGFVDGKKKWIDVKHGDCFSLIDIDHNLDKMYRVGPHSKQRGRYA